MTSLLVTKTLFANKINTIAVFAVLEATIIFQKYCSTIQRAIFVIIVVDAGYGNDRNMSM